MFVNAHKSANTKASAHFYVADKKVVVVTT